MTAPPPLCSGFWQAPAPAASLVRSTTVLPGSKWDAVKDLRIVSWNVQGLDYQRQGEGAEGRLTHSPQPIASSTILWLKGFIC